MASSTVCNAFIVAIVVACGPANAIAQTTPTLEWDEPSTSYVTGYAVTMDGVRVDYGLSPIGLTGQCGCAIALPFNSGQHTVAVHAYNPFGDAQSLKLTIGASANAGGPYTGHAGAAVAVNGSGSSDTLGTISSYMWMWGDGSSTATASPSASHTYANGGMYDISLTVTDNGGAAATATTTATIGVNMLPTVRLTSPAAGSIFKAPATITVTAVAGDADGTVAAVYLVSSNRIVAVLPASRTATYTNVPAGKYVLAAAAVDNVGAVTLSSTVTITVTK